MKNKETQVAKELYHQLRTLSCEQLWREEVPRFDQSTPRERMDRVAVVRAVGVVFSESGTPQQQAQAREWLLQLLNDPEEKIRRYAMTALPKIGAGGQAEAAMLAVLRKSSSDREKRVLAQTLDRIGGEATLEAKQEGEFDSLGQPLQKLEANLSRARETSTVLMDQQLSDFEDLRIHLRGRSGLEQFIAAEVKDHAPGEGKFRVTASEKELIVIEPLEAFCLGDLYSLRCFSTAGIVLGTVNSHSDAVDVEALAAVIASPKSRRILETFTEGPLRYRLDFVSKGHQRGAVRSLANRVYTLCPSLLNDSREAPWQIDIHPTPSGLSVELSPRLRPDPRFAYRLRDVPAASHPPLAASMARLAGKATGESEIIWDPFCGSGLELIEAAFAAQSVGGRTVVGTDLSADAIAISEENFAAAHVSGTAANFVCCDFRDYSIVPELRAGTVSAIITNPPMGRRVPIPDLEGLIQDLFAVATEVLKPGGVLVFVNPLSSQPRVEPGWDWLKLQFQQRVDLGSFHCFLQKYTKVAS